jgi:DNA-binding NarL/FixJ family response regulator
MTPDIAFLDISMPELDGLQVLQELHGFPKAPAVIMLSMHPEKAYAIKVVQAGAKAYLTKDSDDETLLKAVRVVALGGLFFSGTGTHLFQDHLSQVDIDKTESKSIDWAILSVQEKQVLKYSCQGMSIKEIAFEMEVAENTVSTYKSRLMKKLEVDNFVDLIRLAIATELE